MDDVDTGESSRAAMIVVGLLSGSRGRCVVARQGSDAQRRSRGRGETVPEYTRGGRACTSKMVQMGQSGLHRGACRRDRHVDKVRVRLQVEGWEEKQPRVNQRVHNIELVSQPIRLPRSASVTTHAFRLIS
jgi:hypothetical protein